MQSPFSPGTPVAVRNVFRGRNWTVHGSTVVSDTPELTVLAQLPGDESQVPAKWAARMHGEQTSPGSHWDDLEAGTWTLEPWKWKWTRLLALFEPAKHYAVYLYWSDADARFICWYVNFQLPFRRTPVGFDTLDLALDMVVGDDRQWSWKDLEQYREGVERGIIDADTAAAVELARVEVTQRVESGASPFDETWRAWSPDPEQPSASPPASWDVV